MIEGWLRAIGTRSASALVNGYDGSRCNVHPDVASGNRRTNNSAGGATVPSFRDPEGSETIGSLPIEKRKPFVAEPSQ